MQSKKMNTRYLHITDYRPHSLTQLTTILNEEPLYSYSLRPSIKVTAHGDFVCSSEVGVESMCWVGVGVFMPVFVSRVGVEGLS